MKINSLYISSFGKIKNLKIDFADGFNLIYGQNENGKSTVMAFIKMMFYGSDTKSSSLAKNIRKKYTPWDSSQMAGSVDFEHGGKKYRIEKEFRSGNSTDKTTLFDLDLGTKQSVDSAIGVGFFGLSSAAFERSVFIGQFGFPQNDAAAEGEINSKLANITATADEDVSFDTVLSRIQKARYALISKSGRAGEYDKNEKALGEVGLKIVRAEEAHKSYLTKKAQASAIEGEINLVLKKAEALKIKLRAEEDFRNAEKYERLLSLKAELDALNQSLILSDGKVLDEMFLKKLQFCISKVGLAENRAEAKQNEIEIIKKSIAASENPQSNEENISALTKEISILEANKQTVYDAVSAKNSELSKLENELALGGKPQKSKALLFILAVISAILGVAGIIGFTFNTNIALAAVGGGLLFTAVILFILGITKSSAQNRKTEEFKAAVLDLKLKISELNSELSRLQSEISQKSLLLTAATTAATGSTKALETQKKMLEDALSELEELKLISQNELDTLLQFYSVYKNANSLSEITDELESLNQKTAKGKELKANINFIFNDIGNISYELAKEKLDKIKQNADAFTADFEQMKAEYDELLKSVSNLKAEYATVIAEAKGELQLCSNLEELKKSQLKLRGTCLKQKAFCDSADLAAAVLSEAFAELRRNYGSQLEKSAAEIFSRLTDNKYSQMTVSKAFDITVSETDAFGSREIDYLSSGTCDQAYLSLRLALSELICENGENLPLFLDDALAQYDDTRLENATKFLSEYSKEKQILSFTCHNSISELSKTFGAKVITL